MDVKRPIYIFTHCFPETGGEPYLHAEIEAIKSENYNVTYCPQDKRSEKQNVLNKESTPKRFDGLRAVFYVLEDLFVAPQQTIRRFRYNVSLVKERFGVARYFTNCLPKNAVLYTYWFDELAITAGLIRKQRPDIKWISRAHGFEVYEEQTKHKFFFFRRAKLTLVNRLKTVSKNGEKHLKVRYPKYADKIGYAYLGISSFGPSKPVNEKSQIVFATCAILRSVKRLDMLMKMIPYLKYEKITWHIIGDGEDMNLLKSMAKKLPEKVECVFQGSCSKEEISEIYKKEIDCFFNVSSSEGLPVSIMEATSAGIPIIATDVGGNGEIVNEQTGVLVHKDVSPEQLAHELHKHSDTFKQESYRNGVMEFWKQNFDANKNYPDFYSSLIA